MSKSDHVGFISSEQLVAEKSECTYFIKTTTMVKSYDRSSETPTNTIEGNEPNKYTHGEVPVQLRLNSTEIQGSIDRMLTATTGNEAEIAGDATLWSFLA